MPALLPHLQGLKQITTKHTCECLPLRCACHTLGEGSQGTPLVCPARAPRAHLRCAPQGLPGYTFGVPREGSQGVQEGGHSISWSVDTTHTSSRRHERAQPWYMIGTEGAVRVRGKRVGRTVPKVCAGVAISVAVEDHPSDHPISWEPLL